jgi:predicted acetyltransferase
MDFFFSEKALRAERWEDSDGEELYSMAYAIPYDAVLYGTPCRIPYLIGVATEEKYRHQGRMTKLLEAGIEKLSDAGYPLVVLSPADPAIYEHMDFLPAYQRETTVIDAADHASLNIRRWCELSEQQKQALASFAEEQIQKKDFDLHFVHHRDYYECTDRELQALSGSLLEICEDDRIVGAANWIQEDGCQEITELICLREKADEVLKSLSAWVPGESMTVDDSTFIRHVTGAGIRRREQKNPYIMCRMTEVERTLPRCYINDI